MNTATQRMSAEQASMSRAEQRKQRLLEAEAELVREEAEALKMTEEHRRMLFRPFVTVKAEFADLDGLCWTQTALLQLQPLHRRVAPSATTSLATGFNDTYVDLGSSDPTSVFEDDTIRVSSTSTRPSLPSPPPPTITAATISFTEAPCRHRDGTRTRSPIKGLFSARTNITGAPTESKACIVPPVSSGCDENVELGVAADLGVVSPTWQGAISKGRRRPSVPPGLTPSFIYENVASSRPSSGAAQHRDFLATPKPSTKSPFKAAHTLVPFPHRDAPSPPSPHASVPSLLLMPTATPTSSPTSSPTPNSSPCFSAKTARKRLHSLLHDTRRPSTPSSPTLRTIRAVAAPTPLELSSIFARPPGLDGYDCDTEDDETPKPSPITTNHSSPSIPWIQTFN